MDQKQNDLSNALLVKRLEA